MKRLFALVCALLLLSVPGFAHPGRTDGSGGHYDRSTGEYHFHHGYSAHQHPDGVCPYDFKDKTDHSAGGSNYSKPKSTPSVHKPGGNLWYTSSEHRNKALETPAPSSPPTSTKSAWRQFMRKCYWSSDTREILAWISASLLFWLIVGFVNSSEANNRFNKPLGFLVLVVGVVLLYLLFTIYLGRIY